VLVTALTDEMSSIAKNCDKKVKKKINFDT
jgi:hypothetical protein